MKTRAIGLSARHAFSFAASAVMAGAFGYLFLSTAPVRGVSDLYWGLHLNNIMALDDLFELGHIAVYAALTIVAGRFIRSVEGWITIVVSLAALGVGVEFAQGMVGGRSFGLDDMLANVVGICAGFFALVVIGPPRPRRRGRKRSRRI